MPVTTALRPLSIKAIVWTRYLSFIHTSGIANKINMTPVMNSPTPKPPSLKPPGPVLLRTPLENKLVDPEDDLLCASC